MCAQQINSSQSRVNTTYLIQQQINIDGEIDVKKKESFFQGIKSFFEQPKATGDFSGPKSTLDEIKQNIKDCEARIKTFYKQAIISIEKSRTEWATSDNMKSAIQWTKAMYKEGDKLSL